MESPFDFTDLRSWPPAYEGVLAMLVEHVTYYRQDLTNIPDTLDLEVITKLYTPMVEEGQNPEIMKALIKSMLVQAMGRSSRAIQLVVREDLKKLIVHDMKLRTVPPGQAGQSPGATIAQRG